MNSNSGFIALVSAIIISVLLMTVTLTLSFSGFFARANLAGAEYKERSNALAEACVDTALLKLGLNASYAGNENISVGSDSCNISAIAAPVSNQQTINTTGVFQQTTTKIKAVIDSRSLILISWEEIP